MQRIALVALLIMAAISMQVQAQTNTEEAFITINLEAGFVLDPFVISVNGGGEVNAATLDDACTGYINSTPTVQVNWTGEADFLRAFFFSDHDPVLVIQGPDGSYSCADDVNPLILDPVIEVTDPANGLYSVWVGSFAPGQLIPGYLVFTANPDTNIGNFDAGALVQRQAIPEMAEQANELPLTELHLDDRSGIVDLSPGGEAAVEEVTVAGSVPLFAIGHGNPACTGFVDADPSLEFSWSGTTDSLRIFFEADEDTTLLVVTPSGEFICNDDSAGAANLNPLIELPSPVEGDYRVFVGRFDPEDEISGTLTVTESTSAEPGALAVVVPEPIEPSEEDQQ